MAGAEIRLNAFTMTALGHQAPGLWRHPRDRSVEYKTLGFWTELARLLEAGLFDGLFFADVLGVYDVYGGGPAAAVRSAAQVPANDPMLVIPAMAAVTEHLGFGVTVNLSYEPVVPLARRFSTLDHLTAGRVGWNVVTGYLDSAARAVGRAGQAGHDARYDAAEPVMEAAYRLWEASWSDDAVVMDRAAGVYARAERVRAVQQAVAGVAAVHLAEPSPQRTPVIYQAGSSPRGQAFAARHAECVFVSGPSVAAVAPRVAAVRALAAAAGREVVVFTLLTAIVAESDAAARALHEEYRGYVSHEGALALMSGWIGVDLSGYRLDEAVRFVENDAGRSTMENVTRADPSRVWTVRDVAEHVGLGGSGPVFAGSAATVADRMEAWLAATGADGFNLASMVAHETFAHVVRWLVPELQSRGRYKRAYAAGTLRQKLFGRGDRLVAPHPGAGVRVG